MTVSAILQRKGRDVLSVDAGTLVHQAIDLLAERRIGALPVLNNGDVVGVFSERDVIYHLRSEGPPVLDWPVARVMTSPAITVTPEVPVLAALSQMTERRIRHLPVVESGKLVGIVSIGDLVKYRLDRMEHETQAMRAYIMSA